MERVKEKKKEKGRESKEKCGFGATWSGCFLALTGKGRRF